MENIMYLLISSAFNTASEEHLDFYELHICIRDYCFAREDRLVGVAVLQLKDIVDQVVSNFFVPAHILFHFIFQSVPVRDGCRCLRAFQKTKLDGPS